MTMMTEMMTKSCKKLQTYFCEKCDYKTVRKSSWEKHLKTIKHNDDRMMTKSCKKLQKVANSGKKFFCECGKGYVYKQGLYVHRKKCSLYGKQVAKDTTHTNIQSQEAKKQTILEKQVTELTTIVKELIKGGIYNNNTNTNSFNTINKNDIKIFLSNECAEALSIQDFVQRLTITIDDLNNTRQSTPRGIAQIVENNLKPLTIKERPMHHVEQNEWYVKDKKNGWEEDDGTRIISEAQKGIQQKWSNVFTGEHPQWENDDDKTNQYIQLASTTTKELSGEDIKLIKKNLEKKCLITRNNN
jgi:hypothetical protein